MPFISREFTHTLENYNAVNSYYNHGNSNGITTVSNNVLKASQFFFDDLKTLIEEEIDSDILNITFSENLEYVVANSNTKIAIPYINVFNLKISPLVASANNNTSTNPMLVPWMLRNNGSSVGERHYKENITLADSNNNSVYAKAKINKSATEFEINYIIEIYYNTDFLIIDYRPYHDKTIKFTMCCLIKGVDINNKDVVYESGGCNTISNNVPNAPSNGTTLSHNWETYHKISWPEYPFGNLYTKSSTYYPENDNNYPTSHSNTFNTKRTLFIDLINNTADCTKLHDSGITHEKSTEDNVILYKPYCCNGNIEFSDNILTGPTSLTLDTEYVINGETYYCPGDYTAIMAQQNESTYEKYSMRFLLKL